MTWKIMPAITLLLAAFSLIISLGISRFMLSNDSASGMVLAIFSPMVVFLPMVFGQIDVRSSQFLIALPIPSRQLFLARTVSMMALLWAPSLSCALFFALAGRQGIESAKYLIGMSSFATLLISIVQSIKTQELIAPKKALFLLAPIMFWIGIGFFLPIMPILMGCLAASTLIFLKTLKHVPPTFQVASTTDGASKKIEDDLPTRASTKPGTMSFTAAKSILKSVYPWLYCFFLPAAVLQTLGGFNFMLPVFMGASYMFFRQKIRWMWTLPVSSSLLFNAFLFPFLIVSIGGYEAGIHIPQSWKKICFSSTQSWPIGPTAADIGSKPNVIPPIELWKPVSNNAAPVIISPWGELFHPPIIVFQGIQIFNPYAVGKENSERFFNWQCSRAMVAAHGKSFSLKDYQSMGISFIPSPQIQLENIAAMLLMIFLWLCSMEAFEWRGFRVRTSTFKVITIFIFVFASYVLLMWASFPILNSRMEFFLVRLSWILPENPWLTLTILVIPLGFVYWAATKMFCESEYLLNPIELRTMGQR
jgi:hypothetical protein